MLRKKIFYLLLIIYFIGIGFLINNFLVHFKYKDSNYELPIIGFQGLIEKNDTIYIGSSHWNRILLFDKNGNYLTYQGVNCNGRDFEFYFSNNSLKINEYVFETSTNKNKSSFEFGNNVKYVIDKKLPLHISLIKAGKRKPFLNQSLFMYATQSDVGLWFVLMFYTMFIIAFFHDYLLDFKNYITRKYRC